MLVVEVESASYAESVRKFHTNYQVQQCPRSRRGKQIAVTQVQRGVTDQVLCVIVEPDRNKSCFTCVCVCMYVCDHDVYHGCVLDGENWGGNLLLC